MTQEVNVETRFFPIFCGAWDKRKRYFYNRRGCCHVEVDGLFYSIREYNTISKGEYPPDNADGKGSNKWYRINL